MASLIDFVRWLFDIEQRHEVPTDDGFFPGATQVL